MRVPINQVKVNGGALDPLSVRIDYPPKARPTARVELENPITVPEEISVTFFGIPLFMGKVSEIVETQERVSCICGFLTPRVPPLFLANAGTEERTSLRRKLIAGRYAHEAFEALFSKYGFQLVNVGSPPPLFMKGIEVEGDLLEALINYYRDFAPVIYIDPSERAVFLVWESFSRTWNVPANAILSYRITRRKRDYRKIVVGNKPLREEKSRESKEEESCSRGPITLTTENVSENSRTVNYYVFNPEDGSLKLRKSETETYGELPAPELPPHMPRPPRERGVVSKSVRIYREDGTYTEEQWGWVVSGFEEVPMLEGFLVEGDVLYRVPVYSFEKIRESFSEKEEERSPLPCGYELVRTVYRHTTTERVFRTFPEEGLLTAEESIRYRNIRPEDLEEKQVVKTRVSESLRVGRKELRVETENKLLAGTTDVETFYTEIYLEEPPQERTGDEEEVFAYEMVHPDVTGETLLWTKRWVEKTFSLYETKGEITVPLVPVRAGEKVVALGRVWVIEGFTHEITPRRATTTLYVRAYG